MTRRSFMQALGTGALGLLGLACGQAAQTAQPTSAAVATQATAPALAAATSPSAAPAVSGSAATVKITDIQITSAAGSYIAAERGYFRDEGVDAQFLASSASEQVTAVLAGAADVKGWKIGAGAPGSTADIALDRFLHSGGLDIKDIEQTTLGFPEILAAFSNKAIQGPCFQEPFTPIGVEQGLCVRGPIGYDMYPDQQIAVVLFGQKLFSDRELSSHYVRAYTRGVRDYVKGLLQKDRAMFDLVVPILIAHTTVKDRSLFERAIPSGLKADPIPNVQSMKDDQDWFVQHGFVQQPIQVDQFVDLSFVQEAIK